MLGKAHEAAQAGGELVMRGVVSSSVLQTWRGTFSHPRSNSLPLLQETTTQESLCAPTSPAFLGSTGGKLLFGFVHSLGERLHSSSSAGCI